MDVATKQRLEDLLKKADLVGADQVIGNTLRADPNDADALVLRARLTAFKGELDAALFVIDRALKISPQHGEGRSTKAALLLERGRVQEAKALLLPLIKEASAPASAHFNLARCLRAEDDLEGSEKELEKALAKEPGNAFTRFALGEVALELGAVQKALSLVEQSLGEDPKNGDAWLVLARAQIALGHEGDAINNLAQAAEQCPGHAGVRDLLGTTLLLSGDTEKATAHFEELCAQYPDDADALSNLGLCYAAQERLEDSEATYRRALKHDKESVLIKMQLASLLEVKGTREALTEAVKLLKEAVRAPDAGWEAFNELGRLLTVHREVIEPVRGIDMLERARKLAGGSPEPDLNLAVAYARVGREGPMREMCEAVLNNAAASEEMKAEAERLRGKAGA